MAIFCVADELDAKIAAIAAQPFRTKFHLPPGSRDRSIALVRGPTAMRHHAREIITQRLAPAMPRKDGRQTPYRGHPVFVAQHATATCCRGCLARNHAIPKGAELTPEQVAYVVDVICRWIAHEVT